MKIIDKFEIDTKSSFSEIIVPTTDSVRNTYLLDLLLSNDKHVLCVGGTGTGKTVNISQYLMGAAKVQGASRTLFSLFFIPLFFRYFFFLYFFAPSSLLFMLRPTFSSPLPFHPISIFCRPYSTTKRYSPNYNFFCEYKCEHDPRSSWFENGKKEKRGFRSRFWEKILCSRWRWVSIRFSLPLIIYWTCAKLFKIVLFELFIAAFLFIAIYPIQFHFISFYNMIDFYDIIFVFFSFFLSRGIFNK